MTSSAFRKCVTVNLSQIKKCRNSEHYISVNKPLPGSASGFSADDFNIYKQLGSFFALRHADDFRFARTLDRWLYLDPLRGWCACRNEHVEAAKQVAAEAAKVMWRWEIDSDAAAKEILRLAELEEAMRREVKPHECEPGLARLLARGHA